MVSNKPRYIAAVTKHLLPGALALCVILAAFLGGCGGGTRGTESGDQPVRYSGLVSSPNVAPLVGALVEIDDVASGETDQNGAFDIVARIPAGSTPTITISLAGVTAATTLSAVAPSTTAVELVLVFDSRAKELVVVTETPTSVATPTPAASKPPPTASPTSTPTPVRTPNATPEPTATPTPSSSPTVTPSPTPNASAAPSPIASNSPGGGNPPPPPASPPPPSGGAEGGGEATPTPSIPPPTTLGPD